MSLRQAAAASATPTEKKPGPSRLSQVLLVGLKNGGGVHAAGPAKSEPQSFVKKTVPTVGVNAAASDLAAAVLDPQQQARKRLPSASVGLKPDDATQGTSTGTNEPFMQTELVSTDRIHQKRVEDQNRMLVQSTKATQERQETASRYAAANHVLATKLRSAALRAEGRGSELPKGVLNRQAALLANLRRGSDPTVQDNEWHYSTFGESVQTTARDIEMAEILDTASYRIPRLPLMGSTLEPYPFFYTQMGPVYLQLLECVARMTWRVVAKFEELSLHPVADAHRVVIGIQQFITVPTIAMTAGKVMITVRSDPELAKQAQESSSSVPRPTSALKWSLRFAPNSREQKAAWAALRVIEESSLVRPGTQLTVSTRTLSTALNGVWDAMTADEKRAAAAWKLSPPIAVPDMYSLRVKSALLER